MSSDEIQAVIAAKVTEATEANADKVAAVAAKTARSAKRAGWQQTVVGSLTTAGGVVGLFWGLWQFAGVGEDFHQYLTDMHAGITTLNSTTIPAINKHLSSLDAAVSRIGDRTSHGTRVLDKLSGLMPGNGN